MKVLTKCVDIENERFVLIKDQCEVKGKMIHYIGTIPYTELDSKGCMKRPLNGFEMCIGDTIPEALERRMDEIKTRNMNETQLIQYFQSKLSRDCQ